MGTWSSGADGGAGGVPIEGRAEERAEHAYVERAGSQRDDGQGDRGLPPRRLAASEARGDESQPGGDAESAAGGRDHKGDEGGSEHGSGGVVMRPGRVVERPRRRDQAVAGAPVATSSAISR